MTKKRELWLAFAEDELTCMVSVNDAPGGSYLEVELSGMLTPARAYVWNLVMDVVDNATFDSIFLNVKKLTFFTGHTVNDCAIDLLLRFVSTFSRLDKQLHLLLEDGCIKEVLTQALPEKK